MNNRQVLSNPHIFSRLNYKNAYDIAYAEQDMGNRIVSKDTPGRERYEWIMEEYFRQMAKHLRLAKPLRLPNELGVIEIGSYPVKGKLIKDISKMQKYFKKHGVRKIFWKTNQYGKTFFRNAILTHFNWTPYKKIKHRGKVKIYKRKVHDNFEEMDDLKRNTYNVRGYNQFFYRLLPNKQFMKDVKSDLADEPTLIHDYKRL